MHAVEDGKDIAQRAAVLCGVALIQIVPAGDGLLFSCRDSFLSPASVGESAFGAFHFLIRISAEKLGPKSGSAEKRSRGDEFI